jgi:hypothetical protein
MATLMLAVFTVSVGFGVVLPLLPFLSLKLPHLLVPRNLGGSAFTSEAT